MRRALPTVLWACLACGGLRADVVPGFLKGPLNELDVIRRAVRDTMWSVVDDQAGKMPDVPSDQAFIARRAQLEAAAARSDWARVLADATAWNAADPHELYRYWQAYAQLHLGDVPAAQRTLDEKPFADPVLAARVLRLRARLAEKAGDRVQADIIFRRAAEAAVAPAERAEIALEHARFLATEKPDAAIQLLKSSGALESPGATGDSARLFAANLLAAHPGSATAADALYRRLVDGDDKTDTAAFLDAACALSERLWSRGATNDALAIATRAAARADTPAARRKAGFLLGMQECAAAATHAAGRARIEALIREFPDAPESATVQRWLADALLARGAGQEAFNAYARYLSLAPAASTDPMIYALQGRALLCAGRAEEAAGVFERAAQKAETNRLLRADCHFREGDALARAGHWKASADAYARAHADAPQGPLARTALFQAADAATRAGDAATATVRYTRLATDLSDACGTEAALRLAAEDAREGRLTDAIRSYGQLVGNTNLATAVRLRALVGRGRARYRAIQYAPAAADFDAATALDAVHADRLRFLSALAQFGARRSDEAVRRIRALADKTSDASLRADIGLWLAKYAYNRSDWEGAEAGFLAFANTAKATPRAADAFLWAARSSLARNAFTNAVALAAQAVTAAPEAATAPAARLLQAECLIQVARYDEAVLLLEEVLKAKNAAPADVRRARMLRADALFARGADDAALYAEALAAYRALLSDATLPRALHIEAAFKAARALEKIGGAENLAAAERLYYADVVQAFRDLRTREDWVDDATILFFTRGAFALVEAQLARGDSRAARHVLEDVARSGVPAAEDARKRLKDLKEKGSLK